MASTKSAKSKRKKSLKTPIPYTNIFLSLLLILAGAALLIRITFQKHQLSLFSKPQPAAAATESQSAKPAKLYIPKLSRLLTVSDGYIQDNRWTISETGVSYLTTSALPGSNGNSVIYGHNLDYILGPLPKVQAGDKIYVVLTDGNIASYQVSETRVVDPTQVEILDQSTSDSRLTLYTCTGFLDTARFVVVATAV